MSLTSINYGGKGQEISQANRCVPFTGSDSVGFIDVPQIGTNTVVVYTIAGGTIVGVTSGGDTVTITSVPASSVVGNYCPIQFKQIKATGTTATGLFALFNT